jgi:hypothetical protein
MFLLPAPFQMSKGPISTAAKTRKGHISSIAKHGEEKLQFVVGILLRSDRLRDFSANQFTISSTEPKHGHLDGPSPMLNSSQVGRRRPRSSRPTKGFELAEEIAIAVGHAFGPELGHGAVQQCRRPATVEYLLRREIVSRLL